MVQAPLSLADVTRVGWMTLGVGGALAIGGTIQAIAIAAAAGGWFTVAPSAIWPALQTTVIGLLVVHVVSPMLLAESLRAADQRALAVAVIAASAALFTVLVAFASNAGYVEYALIAGVWIAGSSVVLLSRLSASSRSLRAVLLSIVLSAMVVIASWWIIAGSGLLYAANPGEVGPRPIRDVATLIYRFPGFAILVPGAPTLIVLISVLAMTVHRGLRIQNQRRHVGTESVLNQKAVADEEVTRCDESIWPAMGSRWLVRSS